MQNDPVETLTDIQNQSEYQMHCINMIFPNVIHLKENKRLDNEEDKKY